MFIVPYQATPAHHPTERALDHPSALGFYRAQGFVPFARAVETFPDPRLTGHLPRDAAPHVPLLAELPPGGDAHQQQDQR